jgi:catalase
MKLATRVAAPLGIGVPDAAAAAGRLGFRNANPANGLREAPSLSMLGRYKPDLRTRRVAVLVADGTDMLSVRLVLQELTEAGLQCLMIGPQLGHVATATGKSLAVTKTFHNTASVVFDAVLIPGGSGSASALCQLGVAVHFVLEAYKHCKPICAVNEGTRLLATLGFSLSTQKGVALTVPTPGLVLADSQKTAEGEITQEFIAAIALHRHWDRVNVDAIPA